jgi:hypothetical protein
MIRLDSLSGSRLRRGRLKSRNASDFGAAQAVRLVNGTGFYTPGRGFCGLTMKSILMSKWLVLRSNEAYTGYLPIGWDCVIHLRRRHNREGPECVVTPSWVLTGFYQKL